MIKDTVEAIIDEAAETEDYIFPDSTLVRTLKKRITDAISKETVTCELYDTVMGKLGALDEELSVKTGLIDDMQNFMGRIGHLRDWVEFQPSIMEDAKCC